MSNEILNTLILAAFLGAAVAGGYYVTQKQQPAEILALEEEIDAIENRSEEVESLLAQEATADAEAAEALLRLGSRYKVLPATLSSADVVAYMNALSSRGFRSFDISLSGVTSGQTASFYTYQVTGQAYFESLFSFIWHIENNRALYRIRDLELSKVVTNIDDSGVERQVVLAQFSMAVDAYFSSNPDISAPDSAKALPSAAFPPRSVAVNPFFPHILATLPPNSDDLVEIGTDTLTAVIGGTAVFNRNGEMRQLRTGDRVYLGRLSSVDSRRARVAVDLNRGGIRERVEFGLSLEEEPYRQALGDNRLTRRRGPVVDIAPPAPGTPEADGHELYNGSSSPASGAVPADIPRRPQADGAPYVPAPIGDD